MSDSPNSSFSHDSLPPSTARRSSYDFSHQDSLTLLDPTVGLLRNPPTAGGVSTSTTSGQTSSPFQSPRTGPARPPLFHASTMASMHLPATGLSSSLGTTGSLNTGSPNGGGGNDDTKSDDDTCHHQLRPTGYPTDALRRAMTSMPGGHGSTSSPSSTGEYRPVAAGIAPIHFDDVLREKTGREDGISTRPSTLRITVTGEILEGKRNRTKLPVPVSEQTPTNSRRRNNDEDDTREGCVKVFNNIDDFLKDEERRRLKYDAAAAAHAVCQEKAAAIAAAASVDKTSPSGTRPNNRTSPTPAKEPVAEPLAQTSLWISVEDSSDETTELIGRYFGLHPLTIEDCQSRGIREKLEVFPEYLFLVFHALEETATHIKHAHHHHHTTEATTEIMKTTPLKLVVFPSLVLSFHAGGLGSVTTVRKQLEKLYRNRVLNTAWLIHGLLDVVSDSLMPVVDTAAKEADDMEDLIYIINPGRESHKDVLKRMGFIARRLTFLRQRLWSKRDILTSLIEKDWQFFLTGVKVPYLRDIYDHLVIMLHKLDSSIEVIVTLQNTYLAVVSIDVAAISNDGNKAMKTLSAAATILLPLSLIASLMGMNVMVPFDSGASHITFRDLLPFCSICLCMVLISYYLYLYFKKKKYL